MNSFVIVAILLERIAFAVIGFLAAIYGQIGWSIFMGTMVIVLIVGTDIKVRMGQNE